MISEFRSVLAQTNPEDMVRDFEGAVNRSLYYMAEGLKGYKGWVPAIICHSEKNIPFGFINLGYKNVVNMSSNSQGVAITQFEELFTKLRYDLTQSSYVGVVSPDGKTAFIYAACGDLLFNLFRKMLVSLSERLDAPTLKTWALVSDKETRSGFKKRWEQGDFDTPDLDKTEDVMSRLDVSQEVAKDLVRFLYALDMEELNISSAPIAYGRLDLSQPCLAYLTDLMHGVAETLPLYNNSKSYQTF